MRNLTGSSTWDMLHQGCFVPMFLDQSTPLPIVLVRIPKLSSYFFEPETTSLPNARFITSAFIPLDASEIHWKKQHMSTRIQWKKKRRYSITSFIRIPWFRGKLENRSFFKSDLISGPWLVTCCFRKSLQTHQQHHPLGVTTLWPRFHLLSSIPRVASGKHLGVIDENQCNC